MPARAATRATCPPHAASRAACETGVPAGASVSITFDRPFPSFSEGSFLLHQNGTAVPSLATASFDLTEFTRIPDAPLLPETSYTVEVQLPGGGGTFPIVEVWTFTTGPAL